MEYPISLDTALSIVGELKVNAIKEKKAATNSEEIKYLDSKIDMYLNEERILYGIDELLKLSIIDKVINYYSPLIKKINGVA
ncbi:hypothetical protein N4T42_02245 [Riemerella anatipestifer]|uniref:hypothetical protein n=1 Tax=Riemerella anatipestifer TaxID=34085 RepID=UPI0021D576B6|nr:hypothetical protein [Riemerella anatipestifer]MCU7559123.1 hypothetical protein [Riemerella anatipestifer]MDY3317511.1 hypothetical protein [Riemerella anatipestifer]MDY3400695.1 hypothetical protein [Riemerella anatipestifer]